MTDLIIEGGIPLMGNVALSGSKNSALKLIYASLFTSEDVIIDNIPNISMVRDDIDILTDLGVRTEWIGTNRLLINAGSLSNFEVPYNLGSLNRTAMLAAAPLLFRFGKARIPKINRSKLPNASPVNRLVSTWESFGVSIEEDERYYTISCQNLHPSTISFKTPTHIGTDNALMFASIIPGDSVINNASEAIEVMDLIEFLKNCGVDIIQDDPKTIRVRGTNIFKGNSFKVQSDITEAVNFATLAALTKGNVLIKGVDKTAMTSFSSFLSKSGIKFEYDKDEFKVWNNNMILEPVDITVGHEPAFSTDWQPCATLLMTQAQGQSRIHETVYTDRFSYIKDLNRMGADIRVVPPSTQGMEPVISDDSYDPDKQGEPSTLLLINGPTKLHGAKLDISGIKNGPVVVNAALSAEGRSQISGWEDIERIFEDYFEKIDKLGAKIFVE